MKKEISLGGIKAKLLHKFLQNLNFNSSVKYSIPKQKIKMVGKILLIARQRQVSQSGVKERKSHYFKKKNRRESKAINGGRAVKTLKLVIGSYEKRIHSGAVYTKISQRKSFAELR